MRIVLLLLFVALGLNVSAQETAAKNAKAFIKNGDYGNAVLILNRLIASDGDNIELKKDLAFAYYMQRDYPRAISAIKPVTESRSGDAQSFQILSMVYKAMDDRKEAERSYRAGLRRFSESGALYSELGELLWSNGQFPEANAQWQKGIQKDPGYAGNYYHAARYYYMTSEKVRGLIYGEIFINLESYSRRTPEIKTMLLEGYKKLFSEMDLLKNQDTRNQFIKAYLETMQANSEVVLEGITPESLAALRTRFLLTWFEKYGNKFPYRLFEFHRQLARQGMFDAYNQWIFAAASNLTSFQQWTVTHSETYNKFLDFQKSRVFKIPAGQAHFK